MSEECSEYAILVRDRISVIDMADDATKMEKNYRDVFCVAAGISVRHATCRNDNPQCGCKLSSLVFTFSL